MFAVVVMSLLSFCAVREIPRRVVRGKSVEWWGEAAKRLIH
jgi:hypothetical protein